VSQRSKRKKHPNKTKFQRSRLDAFRRFLAKNRDILTFLGLIMAALSLFFMVYFSTIKVKPQIQPQRRFKIEQTAPSIPVHFVKGENAHNARGPEIFKYQEVKYYK
jgi:hypothetical protein